jgi:hypothetical protein
VSWDHAVHLLRHPQEHYEQNVQFVLLQRVLPYIFVFHTLTSHVLLLLEARFGESCSIRVPEHYARLLHSKA